MAEKKIPFRKCIGCGLSKDKRELLRVIKTPEGEICFDETGRKNGRGAYLCKDARCLAKVKKTKGLDRSFKMAVSSEVYESLEREFVKFESTK
jgi:hypothetical protein